MGVCLKQGLRNVGVGVSHSWINGYHLIDKRIIFRGRNLPVATYRMDIFYEEYSFEKYKSDL